MLKPSALNKGEIMAMDRPYIDYEKFEELTQRGVVYLTKLKKSLRYKIKEDVMYQTPDGLMEARLQDVTFYKQIKDGDTIIHNARIVTYVDI